MTRPMSRTMDWRWGRVVSLTAGLLLAGCASQLALPRHLLPLPRDTLDDLSNRRLRLERPIFIRIFKEESELEVWKLQDDGRYQHFRTYPICTWSGELGPKILEGDKQSPEGFYAVTRQHMNPNSQFHLSFDLGFPNAFDRSRGRTGKALMVHGKCSSAGCYAITDTYVEEVYALAREAFIGGQDSIPVHVFPFRMTNANLLRHASSEHVPFWSMLKLGYDAFEQAHVVPTIVVCGRQYIVNPIWHAPLTRPPDPIRPCPAHDQDSAAQIADTFAQKPQPVGRVLPGRRMRTRLADGP